MSILLDTCTFLWWASGDACLSPAMVERLRQPAAQLFLSAASAWEIALKHAAGRLQLPQDPAVYVPRLREHYAIEALPIGEEEALHLRRLPPLHRDPFDRMLVSQAIVHGLEIATPDRAIHAYPARVLWLEN